MSGGGTNRICCNLSLCVGGDCYAWIVSSCAEDTSPAQPRVSARARETETRQLINLARGECGEVARVVLVAMASHRHCPLSLLTAHSPHQGQGRPSTCASCLPRVPSAPSNPVAGSCVTFKMENYFNCVLLG